MRDGCLLRPDEHAVGSHVTKVLGYPVMQTISGTQHDDQHEDPPGHTEAGEERNVYIIKISYTIFL